MMDITIDEAIKAMTLFRDTAPENGYVASCYNMAISALKTIQDGNYAITSEENVSRETLQKIHSYDCGSQSCDTCDYWQNGHCICMTAKFALNHDTYMKEVEKWIKEHSWIL